MPGGCFLTTATIEYDARPGPMRDAVAAAMKRWLGVLEREVATAIEAGELPPDTEPADVAFQLNALRRRGELRVPALAGPRGVRRRAPIDAQGAGLGLRGDYVPWRTSAGTRALRIAAARRRAGTSHAAA